MALRAGKELGNGKIHIFRYRRHSHDAHGVDDPVIGKGQNTQGRRKGRKVNIDSLNTFFNDHSYDIL